MKVMSGMRISDDSGFSRLGSMPKWGLGNTSPTPHQQPRTALMRVVVHEGGTTLGAHLMVTMKAWSLGDGTPRLTFTADRALVEGLELYVESTATEWILVAKASGSGTRVEVETIGENGFFAPRSNDPFVYAPSGPLIKPVLDSGRRTPTTGATANQWIKLATLRGVAAYGRYAALISVAEVEAVNQHASAVIASLMVNFHPTSGNPTVGFQELTSVTRQAFELHTVVSTDGTTNQVEVWAKALLTYSTLTVSILGEGTFAGDGTPPSVEWHLDTAWTSTAPAGSTRMRSGQIEHGLTLANSWVAASGYGSVRSTGIVAMGRVAYLNATLTGGTVAAGTKIADFSTAYAPGGTLDVPCLVTDGSGVHSLGRLAVYTNGSIVILGTALPANTKVSVSAAWPIAGFGS